MTTKPRELQRVINCFVIIAKSVRGHSLHLTSRDGENW